MLVFFFVFFFWFLFSPLTTFARNAASELVINKCGCAGNVLLHHYVVGALIRASNEL